MAQEPSATSRGKCTPPRLTRGNANQLLATSRRLGSPGGSVSGVVSASASARIQNERTYSNCVSDTEAIADKLSIDSVSAESGVGDVCEDILIAKLKACTILYDFTDPDAQLEDKEDKLAHLQDIVEHVSTNKGVFTERILGPFMEMVSANILRDLPVGSSTDETYDAEEDEPSLEPAWPHLKLVYDLLKKFIISSESETLAARALITPRFVSGVVELFNSEDPREREFLKLVLHRIYGKVMPLRAPIRLAITHAFCRVVHDRTRHNGISELLEILGSIINGFSIPLKEEHKSLLRRALLPLHTVRTMPEFHNQLSFCVVQFVKKDPSLACEVVKEMVRHWPVTHTRKEVMFLNELEEVIECAQPSRCGGNLGSVVLLLFKRLARSTKSLHFQVAERVLYFWNNSAVVALFEQHRVRLMPVIVGALHENMTTHWNPSVQNLSFHVRNLLHDLDADLYDLAMREYHVRRTHSEARRTERINRWREVDAMAERRRRAARSMSLPQLPTALPPERGTRTSAATSMDDASFTSSVLQTQTELNSGTNGDDNSTTLRQAAKYRRSDSVGELSGRFATAQNAPVSA